MIEIFSECYDRNKCVEWSHLARKDSLNFLLSNYSGEIGLPVGTFYQLATDNIHLPAGEMYQPAKE